MTTDKKEVAPVAASEAPKKLVKLVSRLNYPVQISYNKDTIFIAPQGTILDLEPELIESKLPKGILTAEYNV